MDRDEVNFVHHLYQNVEIGGAEPPLWSPDTMPALEHSGFIAKKRGKFVLPAGFHSFIKEVENQLNGLPGPTFLFGYPISDPVRAKGDLRAAFLAIPCARRFDKIKRRVLAAAKDAKFACEVTGDIRKPGVIVDQVWRGIRRAEVVVADITGANPNVMIEVGIAASLGKEVILLTQDRRVPFDIRQWRVIRYAEKDMPKLEVELARTFGDVADRFPFDSCDGSD